jgi:Holliday junction resolvasome RuvABC endonuclease subunit
MVKNFCYTRIIEEEDFFIMIVLALDPSTKVTGFAVYKDQELIDHGYINAGSADVFNRIHKMISEIEEILNKYEIDKAILEEVLPEDVRNNNKTFKALMYLQAFITDCLHSHKIEYSFFVASEWRKKCGIHTGRGIKREILKTQDIKFVQSQYGIKVNDDEADAICIGFAAVGGIIKEPQVIVDDSGFEFA